MRFVGRRECESCRQVSFQHGRRRHGRQQRRIDRGLVGFAVVRDHGGLRCVAPKEFAFSVGFGRILGSRKVIVVEFADIGFGDVDFGAGRNDVGRIDATEWHTIDFVGAAD